MDFIDSDGYGNCQKRDPKFHGSVYSCYVKEPSRCKDKKFELYPHIGKTRSAIACLESNYKLLFFFLRSTLFIKELVNIMHLIFVNIQF